MSLRLKVILSLIALTLPLTATFSAARMGSERRAMQERVAERAAQRLTQRPLQRCIQEPSTYQGQARRFTLYAYDERLRSDNPQAPPFPASMAAALERLGRDEDDSLTVLHDDPPLWRELTYSATLIHHSGPRCRVILMVWRDHPERGPARDPHGPGLWRAVLGQTLIFLIALLGSGLLITIPLVRRIRRLTRQVQDAPATDLQIRAELTSRDELGDLARAFNQMGAHVQQTIAQLHQRDQTLKDYIANTTHDLAIPLTVLQHRLTHLRALARDQAPLDSALIDGALQESHYIASLIDNMSAAAKLDAGQAHLKKHRFDLGELVARVASRHEPIAATRQIELNFAVAPEPAWILADSTLIEQALSNLTQNAVQYASPGGHVAVVLDVSADRFELQILDDGPGIPAALLPQITARHARGDDDARTRNPKGQGFGLSIVSAVCALHDITFSLENMDEGGLRATLSGELAASDASTGSAR